MYVDANFVFHGFVRSTNGTFTTFDAPGAATFPFSGEGTVAYTNNPSGAVVGYFVSPDGLAHGFLRSH